MFDRKYNSELPEIDCEVPFSMNNTNTNLCFWIELRNQSVSKHCQSIAIKQRNSTIEVEGIFFLGFSFIKPENSFQQNCGVNFRMLCEGIAGNNGPLKHLSVEVRPLSMFLVWMGWRLTIIRKPWLSIVGQDWLICWKWIRASNLLNSLSTLYRHFHRFKRALFLIWHNL